MLLADFLARLPELFRKRYLNRHERSLKSFADTIAYLYLGWDRHQPKYFQMISQLPLSGSFPLTLRDRPNSEQSQFRHLRNAWYHELAVRYPDDFDSRTKFAGWKIIQGYYCVFSSISALVRCLHGRGNYSHNQTISVYARELIASPTFSPFFLPPAGMYLNQQGTLSNYKQIRNTKYTDSMLPQMRKCLRSVREGRHDITTLVHYLKSLREWATYEDSYLLFRMYGQTVKDNLDFSLQTLSSFYVAHTEFFLIRSFGLKAVRTQSTIFLGELERNMHLDHPLLRARFELYPRFGLRP